MPAKNIQDKFWNLVPTFDGFKYSFYPLGDKPSGYQTAPTLLNTDKLSGSLTGGESNKGSYLRLFGYALGRQDRLGSSAGARVFLRDPLGDNAWHEVDNYRALLKSRVYDVLQVSMIIVQVGALGGSQTAGRALDVKITVNGVDTNILTGQFTIQPGDFWFADNVEGDDNTGVKNNIGQPYRYAQFAVDGLNNFTGIWAPGNLQAGDTLILRGGTWSDQTGFNTRFIRFRSHTGSPPTGVVGHGYIAIEAYPGPILGHTPEDVRYVDPPGGAGCIQGVNSAYAGLYGMYVTIAGLRMECSPTSTSDAGFVNFQNNASHWRVMDNEMGPWAAITPAPLNAKAGGVAGNGDNMAIFFNYMHDVGCGPGALENHGIYLDGSSNGGTYNACVTDTEVAYNWVKNITGGNGIQCFNQVAELPAAFTGIRIHHNYIDTTGKYGINLADFSKQIDVWNNIVVHTTSTGLRFNTSIPSAVINCTHNLFYDCNTNGLGPAQGAINNDGNFDVSDLVRVRHNIVVLKQGRGAGRSENSFYSSNGTGDSILSLLENLYFDADATVSAPAKDTAAVVGDPLWTDSVHGDYTVLPGGAGLAQCSAAEVLAIATDIFGVARPVTGTGAPGATRNDIGPTQGAGT